MNSSASRPSMLARALERAGWALAGLALVALGMLWHMDRTRVWDVPRWDDPRLVVLRSFGASAGAPGAASASSPARDASGPAPAETWAVAVNLECPHCRQSVERAVAASESARSPFHVAMLLVDTEREPPSRALDRFHVDEVRWDARGIWRARWGHRIYGEILCFDRAGRLIRTLPPAGEMPAGAGPGEPHRGADPRSVEAGASTERGPGRTR